MAGFNDKANAWSAPEPHWVEIDVQGIVVQNHPVTRGGVGIG